MTDNTTANNSTGYTTSQYQPKTITKIVTFYSDGTFSESFPSPYPQWNPYTVPYTPPPSPYPMVPGNPWWQQQVFCGNGMWGVPNAGKSSEGNVD